MLGLDSVTVTGVIELALVARIRPLKVWRVGLSVIVCEVDVFVEAER